MKRNVISLRKRNVTPINKPKLTMTPEELQGMQMIIDLQKLSGIDEEQEVALNGWRRMSQESRATTRSAHRVMFPDKYKDQVHA
jgi:hypothetical protein